jgi:hypothetical protein
MRPTLATVLLLLLMAVIGTAVPFPLFFPLREAMEPQVPPLIEIVRPYIASLVVLGSRGAVFATNALAPEAVESSLVAAQRIGAFAGMVVAAVAPAWLLVGWSRRRVTPPSVRPGPLHNVPLAIAIIWTLLISRPLVGLVGAAVFPTDTWLMLPSVAVAPGAEPGPARWCAHKLHPSVFACEAERMASTARKDESINGFAYGGARCVSAADVERPSCEPPADAQAAPAAPPAS